MNSKNKVEVVKKMNPLCVIEDMPETIKSIAKLGFTVFYPTFHEYTKNLNITNAIGFDSWKDLFDLILIL